MGRAASRAAAAEVSLNSECPAALPTCPCSSPATPGGSGVGASSATLSGAARAAPSRSASLAAGPRRRRALALACGVCSRGRLVAGEYSEASKVESAKLYGNINQYAYYFTDLFVGDPEPQRVSVIVDTGSSLCGFPCDGCEHCGDHIDPPFSIKSSQSFQWVRCGGHCEGICQQDRCSYTQSYTEGSSISGIWFQDQVRLGDSLQRNPPVNATLGCHLDERNLFYTQRANGIMGMAPHENSGRPTILQDLFVDRKHVNTGIWAMCLSEWGGQLSIGGYDPEYHANGSTIQWMKLLHSGYYSVPLARLVSNGVELASGAIVFGTALIDSGTTFTYFPRKVFRAVAAHVAAVCAMEPGCEARPEPGEEGCWRLNHGSTDPSHFPILTMEFEGGIEVDWPSRAYLYQRGDPHLWCHAFADNGMEMDTVLGLSWLLHKNVVFDLIGSRLGVVEARCPEYSKPDPVTFGLFGGVLALGAVSSAPLLVQVLNAAWILASFGAAAGLAWFIYASCCDEARLYHQPEETEGSGNE